MTSNCIQSHDTMRELWTKINTVHCSYLREQNLTLKAKYRDHLQQYIFDLLSILPYRKVFNFQETTRILHDSIKILRNSDMVKLVNAWFAVGQYANNLYSQPWRKEYHEIKLYCGFYKHQVENYLVGVENLMQIMGYEWKPDHKWSFNPTTDPELICAVSLDAFIAFAECQMIFSIHKDIAKKVPSCSFRDILEYRQTHACTVDGAVQGIYYLNYCPLAINNNNNNNNVVNAAMDCCTHGYVQPDPFTSVSSYIQYPPLPSCVSHCHCVSSKCHRASLYGCCNKNGYQSSYSNARNGIISHKKTTTNNNNNNCNVPTGKLIDIDSRKSISEHQLYDSSNHLTKRTHRYSSSDVYSTDETDSTQKRLTNSENWDYVYKGLQNKDKANEISNKFRDRSLDNKIDDNKNRLNKSLENRQYRDRSLENLLDFSKRQQQSCSQSKKYATTTTSKSLKVSDALNNLKLDADAQHKKDSSDFRFISKTVPTHRSLKISLLDSSKKKLMKNRTTMNLDEAADNKWQCVTCTFLNCKNNVVCEMCGKSKKTGNELKPLISGGKHCPQCTLVNSKDALKCEACEYNLKDSPTYI